jgi:hypothetical protein
MELGRGEGRHAEDAQMLAAGPGAQLGGEGERGFGIAIEVDQHAAQATR